MLTWVLLTLAITTAPPPPSPQPPAPPPAADARTQAEQLARSGSYRAALERFQALAAANPDDIEARIWIARLHALMGDDERAVSVYESIVATHPNHFDALVGLGDAFVRMGRLREAGVKTIADEEEGAATYIALRAEWDYLVAGLAPHLGYSMEEIDPAGSHPEQVDAREPFAARLRSGE